MSDSINSLSPDFRDFLLNRNLITDTVTDNGLDALLGGVGLPITNVGTPPESVQPSPDIIEDGDLYKDLNLVNNKFQGNDNDYYLKSIAYQPLPNPPTTAYIYSPGYINNYTHNILSETLNTPPNGPFQGGDIRQFNTSKNLYDDPDMRSLIELNDVVLPNVKYTNYQDLNAGIVNNQIDVLGTILGGGQVGLNTDGGIEPNFDLRSSLAGRVLGGTGVISDTPLGQAGAKYLALALANNAAFGLQQETIGNLNLNPLNIAMNGVDSIVVPNYDITVPSGKLGKVIDFGARVLGFESPVSLFANSSSIFASENPVGNIIRANAQISNTGKGQILSLFSNIKINKYKPGFSDSRIKEGVGKKGEEGANSNIYAFGTVDGQVVDFLNTNVDLNNDDEITGDEFNVNSPISQSNYNLEGLIDNSGFGQSPESVAGGSDASGGYTWYTWGDDTLANNPGKRVFGDSGVFKDKKTLLGKTKSLFDTNKMRTIVSGKASKDGNIGRTETQSSVNQGFYGLMSKGSGVLSEGAVKGGGGQFEPEDVYCRVWTTFDRYNQVQDLQKNSGITTTTVYRDDLSAKESVLDNNGFVRIAPIIGDSETGNIKRFMFSIENLAWADEYDNIIKCEKGPGDVLTGSKGRIMWFPPYDLSVTDNTSVNWESTNFIGRGEPIYTYNNTERTGTLQFKIVVDHPSYLNALKSESDEYIASFFAGCTDIDGLLAEKLTTTEKDVIETKNATQVDSFEIQKEPEPEKLLIYFPNDSASIESGYENGDGVGLGTTTGGGFTSDRETFPDRTDFGLNVDFNNRVVIAPELSAKLTDECPACNVVIKGYASIQGTSKANKRLSEAREESVKDLFLTQILTDVDLDDRASRIKVDKTNQPVSTDGAGCPTIKDEETGERIQNQDIEGCKINRFVEVVFEFSEERWIKLNKPEKPVLAVPETSTVSKKIVNRFYNECNYFEKLKEEDSVVYSSLKEKLKFFHPAFHAITPEGLNSRLTFLQQCTRQGPTYVDNTPDNLAFGRPPVCILRLGDFYHTKIIIDNVGISYEPLVWDLNPEGIGVQPMIATVDLSFKMIGGQSMKGPINRLQNAISYNFFANTEVYDIRADKIGADDKIIPGKTPTEINKDDKQSNEKDGINGNSDNQKDVDQVEESDNSDSKNQEDNTESNDRKLLGLLGFGKIDTSVQMQSSGNIKLSWDNTNLSGLSKKYKISLQTQITTTGGWLDVLTGYITATGSNNIVSSGENWKNKYINDGDMDPNFQIPVSYKVTIEVKGEKNLTEIFTRTVAGRACAGADAELGDIMANTQATAFEEGQSFSQCDD